jgi:sodium transport system permease protein
MNLRNIGIIARKELKDVLRDRRTLFFMILLPMVATPALMIIGSKFIKSQAVQKENRVLLAAVEPGQQELLRTLALRWRNANLKSFIAVGARLGLDVLDDQDAFFDRLAKLEALQSSGGGSDVREAAAVNLYKGVEQLSIEQKHLLSDWGAISKFLDQIEWVRFDTLTTDAALAPGVVIPEDLPPELARTEVAVAIQEKVIQAALSVPIDLFDRLESPDGQVPIHVLYDRSINLSREFYDRFLAYIEALERHEIDVRLRDADLRPGFIAPYLVEGADIATRSRAVQALIGGFLPYLLFIFCFMGAFYPALDLTAGEKERFTLETLLLAPVSRMDIAAGKFVVTFLASITSAILFTLSMYFTITEGILPKGTAATLQVEFQPLALALTASLLVPIAALTAAVVLGVALCGRSFKEAQNYVTPLQFLFFIPAIVAILPDLETETHLAWIPLVNVAMLMKELMKGNYLWEFYWITLASMVVLTAAALWGAAWLFRRESVLMRT